MIVVFYSSSILNLDFLAENVFETHDQPAPELTKFFSLLFHLYMTDPRGQYSQHANKCDEAIHINISPTFRGGTNYQGCLLDRVEIFVQSSW